MGPAAELAPNFTFAELYLPLMLFVVALSALTCFNIYDWLINNPKEVSGLVRIN